MKKEQPVRIDKTTSILFKRYLEVKSMVKPQEAT